MAKKPRTAKVITRRKKFIKVDIPLTNSTIELIGNSPQELEDTTIKLDLTRQLKGKSVEAVVKIDIVDEKAVAKPIKIKLMPYFIRRMIRKRISYVEDSFETPSQESMIRIKPFLITRKRVSRVVRKTLRNKARNWIEDYIAERKDSEIFNEILSNRMQKPLSLTLKKTYPLSLCEIRVLEVQRPLKPEEVPKIKPKPKKEIQTKPKENLEEGLDQLAEIEEEKKKKAEEEIKQAQEKAVKKEDTDEKEKETELEDSAKLLTSESKDSEPATKTKEEIKEVKKATKKPAKKETETKETEETKK
jgi:ribosomal protein S3AE